MIVTLDGHAEEEQSWRGKQDRKIGIDAKLFVEHQRQVHTDRKHGALGKVDDIQHAEDQRQPHGDQSIDAANQHTGDERLAQDNFVVAPPADDRAPVEQDQQAATTMAAIVIVQDRDKVVMVSFRCLKPC